MNEVTLSDDDVQNYFTANQEKYREPERVRIKLVDFRPQDFAAQITPTDAEVQAYYDAHQEDYRSPEEVRARHILFKLAPDAKPEDKAAARKQAEDVLAKAKGGTDFAELAKQYSQDSTAAGGGDLGQVRPRRDDAGVRDRRRLRWSRARSATSSRPRSACTSSSWRRSCPSTRNRSTRRTRRSSKRSRRSRRASWR